MAQLASILRKSLALSGMVDRCPGIKLTPRFSAFQYTARLKLLGLTRYDTKSRRAPPEDSSATCANDSLDCCTAEDGPAHSHSNCTSDNEACFCGIQKVEDVQSLSGAPDKEPKELCGPANDGRGMPQPSPYATLGVSSGLVSSNSHLDHGLASAVITVSNEDRQTELSVINWFPSKLILITKLGYGAEVYERIMSSPLDLLINKKALWESLMKSDRKSLQLVVHKFNASLRKHPMA